MVEFTRVYSLWVSFCYSLTVMQHTAKMHRFCVQIYCEIHYRARANNSSRSLNVKYFLKISYEKSVQSDTYECSIKDFRIMKS